MTNDPTNPGVPDAETPKTDVPRAADISATPATIPPAPAPLPPPAPSAIKGTGIAASDGPPKPVTTVTTGTLIMGTYEIEKLINSGGMGEVYRGRNIHNGEPVAIKIVLPSLAHDPKIVALFQKESTTLSRLSHEAIVRYHVFTVDPTIGRPCMVMEFVSGTAMSDRIEQGPMEAEDVRVMLRRVASGLDKAHRAGVVHRDLSPDNVILEEGMVEHAKLIDFGIAKSTAMGAGTLLQGQFAGKFNWVAPEQLGAFGGVVDGRSDIYSLALVTAGASRGEVLQMGASIVDAVGKRSSVPDLTGVDASLVPLLTWMLQPDPGQRPENMARVIAALDNPNLIPNATPPEPKAADPNRTIIGGALPAYEVLSAQTAKSAPPLAAPPPAALPPVSKLPDTSDWDSPAEARKPNAPEGATVIASPGSFAPRPVTLPEEEPEDFSPFGAATTAKPAPPAAAAAAPKAAKKGAGGLIGVLAVLALGAGGAGAYFGGFLDAALIGADGPVTDLTAPVETVKPVDTTATVEAIAADDAAAAQLAEEKATAEAAVKLAADQAAAKLAEEQAAADALAAAEAAKQAEAKAAEDAAAAVAAAELAKTQTAEEKAASDAAAAQKAVDDAAIAALAAEEAAAKLKADEAAAAEAAKLAEDAKLAADAAAQKVAEDAAAAEKLAAEEAAQKAAAEAAKADPVLSQQAFLASYVAPDCVYLGLLDPKPEGFVLDGFAADTKPLEQMSQEWTAATTTKPDVVVHLVSPGQCAALNFAVQFPDTAPKQPLTVIFDNPSAIVKNGSEIKGTVQGLEGRTLTLFYVTSKGTVTNVNKFTVAKDDGTVRFGFTMNIPKASASEPQVFLAIAGDKDVATFLNRLPEGKSAESVFKFVSLKLQELALPTASALAFVQVDN